MKLDGKVVIVTGTGTGIGKTIAQVFAKEGASVVACSRRSSTGQPVVDEIVESGGRATFVEADISIESDIKHVVKKAIDTYGRIDILVNNAGVNFVKSFENTESEEWDKVINTDLRGAYMFSRYCIIEMLKTGGGSIVNITSVHTIAGYPQSAPYDAAKWAVVGLTKALATEFASRNIRVNALSPGLIDTQVWTDILDAAQDKQTCVDYWKSNIPMERVGLSEEVAKAALFMASDDASYMTGSNVILDGGMTSLLVSKPFFESKPIV